MSTGKLSYEMLALSTGIRQLYEVEAVNPSPVNQAEKQRKFERLRSLYHLLFADHYTHLEPSPKPRDWQGPVTGRLVLIESEIVMYSLGRPGSWTVEQWSKLGTETVIGRFVDLRLSRAEFDGSMADIAPVGAYVIAQAVSFPGSPDLMVPATVCAPLPEAAVSTYNVEQN